MEEIERRLREAAELEARSFGTPVFEHDGDIRLPAVDDEGEWDVMIPAKPVDTNHSVDMDIIDTLRGEMKGGNE